MKFLNKKLNTVKKRILFSIIGVFIIIGLVILYYFINKTTGFAIPCMFHTITGLYCPGCGMTRAIGSLLKLDFYQAFRYNNLVFIIVPFVAYFIISTNISWIFKTKRKEIPNIIIIILIVIVMLYWILRNIPGFEFLRPLTI